MCGVKRLGKGIGSQAVQWVLGVGRLEEEDAEEALLPLRHCCGSLRLWDCSSVPSVSSFLSSPLHSYENTFRSFLGGDRGLVEGIESRISPCPCQGNVHYSATSNPKMQIFLSRGWLLLH